MGLGKYKWYAIKKHVYNKAVHFMNTVNFRKFKFLARKGHFNKDFSNGPDKPGWTMTFNDDFDSSEVDFSKWNRWFSENRLIGEEYRNVENFMDCYKVNDGNIHLYTVENSNYGVDGKPDSDIPYISGVLNSLGIFSQMHGYFEICCKVPGNGKMFWPAFWLYGDSWPPEIDVFEFMDEKDINTGNSQKLSMTLHWGNEGKKGMGKRPTQLGMDIKGKGLNFNEHFHVYAVRWEYDYVEWYIDNVPVFKIPYNVPTNKMGVIANVSTPELSVADKLPGEMVIDYVRVYAKDR